MLILAKFEFIQKHKVFEYYFSIRYDIRNIFILWACAKITFHYNRNLLLCVDARFARHHIVH